MTQRTIIQEVKEWLENGSIDAESLAEVPWVAEVSEDGSQLVAVNPVFPVRLVVIYMPEASIIRLAVNTHIKTVDLPIEAKTSLYRKVLNMSRMPLAKAFLFGDDDEIIVGADLSTKTLSEPEFNDALALMLALLNYLYSSVGIPEEFKQEELINMIWLVKKWFEKGWSREKLEKLLQKAGLKPDEAKEFINQVLEAQRKSTVSEEEPLTHI
ncbi:hypothetical protein PYJP_14350 [Pyrofollis japonicus]|uniref:hypothetical protein n=1 Tax=Pyrofollis japonicus TaxID=3060460 RepID=UPI00295AAD52|nr:hypothetical protein [Pyrofollis japonicus]BEP18083.1 hypothetical protein PYJP_14350 [Pyrofollis japonicus]